MYAQNFGLKSSLSMILLSNTNKTQITVIIAVSALQFNLKLSSSTLFRTLSLNFVRPLWVFEPSRKVQGFQFNNINWILITCESGGFFMWVRDKVWTCSNNRRNVWCFPDWEAFCSSGECLFYHHQHAWIYALIHLSLCCFNWATEQQGMGPRVVETLCVCSEMIKWSEHNVKLNLRFMFQMLPLFKYPHMHTQMRINCIWKCRTGTHSLVLFHVRVPASTGFMFP